MKNIVAVFTALATLLALPCSAFTTLWQIGREDNNALDLGANYTGASTAPGSALVGDDDDYFAGNFHDINSSSLPINYLKPGTWV
jgi:hypothetical protein